MRSFCEQIWIFSHIYTQKKGIFYMLSGRCVLFVTIFCRKINTNKGHTYYIFVSVMSQMLLESHDVLILEWKIHAKKNGSHVFGIGRETRKPHTSSLCHGCSSRGGENCYVTRKETNLRNIDEKNLNSTKALDKTSATVLHNYFSIEHKIKCIKTK